MLSNHENIHRMRCKLVENEHFNLHEEPSRLRDNLSIVKAPSLSQNSRQGSFKIEQRDNALSDENNHTELSHEIQMILSEEKEKM